MFKTKSYSPSVCWKVFKNSSRSVCAQTTLPARGMSYISRLA